MWIQSVLTLYSQITIWSIEVTNSFQGEIFSPFLRTYSPSLAESNISREEFLIFLDGLNEVFLANPVLQATGIAGAVMSNIHPVELVGMGLQAASEIGGEAISYLAPGST
jgi:hypothetical protein